MEEVFQRQSSLRLQILALDPSHSLSYYSPEHSNFREEDHAPTP